MRNQGAVNSQGSNQGDWRRRAAGGVIACLLFYPASPASGESPRFAPRPYAPQPAGLPAGAEGSTGPLGLHSDLRFSVLSAPRKDNDAAIAAYQAQVRRVGLRLQAAAQSSYPEEVKRIGAFDIYVADAKEISTMSSGTGKIAINAGFASVKPTDPWLAFVIAREMGHVVAGHHESNSGASIAVSVLMTLLLPGSGLLKSAISLGGSELASGSRREKQGQEADAVAFKLLAAAGYSSKTVVRSLRQKPLGEEDASTAWATDFHASVARLAPPPNTLVAQGRDMPPQPARGRLGTAGSGRAAASAANVVAVSYKAAEWSGGGCGTCGAQP